MKNNKPKLLYSEEFKRTVVEEIESGVMTAYQACKYYGIGNCITVYKWLATYGLNSNKGKKVIIMSQKEETELITLRRELALLKRELEEAELRAIAWKSMVDAIEIDLGIPVKKKPWSQALLDAREQLYPEEQGSVLPGSVISSASPNKLSTSEGRRIKKR